MSLDTPSLALMSDLVPPKTDYFVKGRVAAATQGISYSTFKRRVRAGKGPKPHYFGPRLKLFRMSEVLAGGDTREAA
jgi:hypothetical protein